MRLDVSEELPGVIVRPYTKWERKAEYHIAMSDLCVVHARALISLGPECPGMSPQEWADELYFLSQRAVLNARLSKKAGLRFFRASSMRAHQRARRGGSDDVREGGHPAHAMLALIMGVYSSAEEAKKVRREADVAIAGSGS